LQTKNNGTFISCTLGAHSAPYTFEFRENDVKCKRGRKAPYRKKMAIIQKKPIRFPNLLSRKYAPYVFISPFFIFFVVFGVFPTFFSFYLSFQEWRQAQGLGAMQWNGIENYTFTLTDPWFWQAFRNTLVLGVYGLAIQPVSVQFTKS
jgi:ABC-type polysaccharide transport system permease subunit